MLYLLDANVLITANDTYYPIDGIPEFWEWILYKAESNEIKIPLEVMEEIKLGHRDALLDWIDEGENERILLLDEAVNAQLLQRVVNDGYANNLTDDELEAIGRDPFLVAYALAQKDRCVVTIEVSKPTKQRQNRKIPDVCQTMGVSCCNPFALYRTLGFRTSWR